MTKKAKKKATQTANTKAARKAVAKIVAASEQRKGTAASVPTGTKSKKAAAPATAAPTNAAPATAGLAPKQRWKNLSDAELRALYAEKVRRPTDSTDRGYLILKIRAAEQGRIPSGPRAPRITGPKTPVTIIFGDDVLAEIDVTAKADGFERRLPYLRTLFSEALATRGHAALASRLVG